MSYQVLARKWRPKNFREMAGQEHVLQALVNALDHNRLHHAYLFTGTRGVGKTTIARILAKCLNCESGISSAPCGTCNSCTEINEGRFVDLIEIDAASHTGVDNMRELTDNAMYVPTRGRFKIYLIDEVHMLSTSSFNALLKTLEEPPEHVKFLLATTDPQKLPVTILSRCLQFNLKNLSTERIMTHLQEVLDKEMLSSEEAALWLLARAADGSMRDALSLTDQAIAFGNGKITEVDVRNMLGTIDQQIVYKIVEALIANDGAALLATVEELSTHNPDYAGAIAELLRLLHRISVAQVVPAATDNNNGDRDRVLGYAANITAEDLQLYYQVGLNGQRDLPLAPDARCGLEMTLLRMLAFKPQGVANIITTQKKSLNNGAPAKPVPVASSKPVASPALATAKPDTSPVMITTAWYDIFSNLKLSGVAKTTAANCCLESNDNNHWVFVLDANNAALFDDSHTSRIANSLGDYLEVPVTASITIGKVTSETPAMTNARLMQEKQAIAEQAFAEDSTVKSLLSHFDGTILPQSITPREH